MHRTLKRQLLKLNLNEESLPNTVAEWQSVINTVSNSYNQYDEDRYLIERSLEISSAEMQKEIRNNKEMSLQLLQVSKMAALGTLAAGVAHELNNPLAIQLMVAEMLSLSENLNEKEKHDLKKIIIAGKRMGSIVKSLLKLARQGNGEAGEKLSVKGVILESLELLKSQFQKENICFELDFPNEEIYIKGNENSLISVFQNLLINSRDAFLSNSNSDKKRFIRIKVENEAEKVVINCTDNAGGISAGVIGKIFDPFFTTKEVGAGTGLGLSISKQIIENHRGTIKVNSSVGLGTEFLLSFPMLAETDIQDNSTIKNEKIANACQQTLKKVLIVDDESDVCDCLNELLSDKFEVIPTSSPQEALKLIEQIKFDLLITDLKMPLISGEKVAEYLQKKQPECKLIFISGHIDGNRDGELNRFQPFRLIEKPFPTRLMLKNIISEFVDAADSIKLSA